MFKTWMSAGFVKVCDNTEAPEIMSNITKLYMAKNESESTLITIFSDEDIDGLSYSADNVPAGMTVTYLKEYTIKTGKDR